MAEERWKWASGYEGVYAVSDRGRVRRVAGGRGAKPGLVLKPMKSRDGYLAVCLSRDSQTERKMVHRLVAEAFVSQTQGKAVVNHINGDKADNRASNLEWVTPSENALHASRVLGANHGKPARRLFTDDQVRSIRSTKTGVRPLARQYGVTPTTIRQIKTGKTYQEVV